MEGSIARWIAGQTMQRTSMGTLLKRCKSRLPFPSSKPYLRKDQHKTNKNILSQDGMRRVLMLEAEALGDQVRGWNALG